MYTIDKAVARIDEILKSIDRRKGISLEETYVNALISATNQDLQSALGAEILQVEKPHLPPSCLNVKVFENMPVEYLLKIEGLLKRIYAALNNERAKMRPGGYCDIQFFGVVSDHDRKNYCNYIDGTAKRIFVLLEKIRDYKTKDCMPEQANEGIIERMQRRFERSSWTEFTEEEKEATVRVAINEAGGKIELAIKLPLIMRWFFESGGETKWGKPQFTQTRDQGEN